MKRVICPTNTKSSCFDNGSNPEIIEFIPLDFCTYLHPSTYRILNFVPQFNEIMWYPMDKLVSDVISMDKRLLQHCCHLFPLRSVFFQQKEKEICTTDSKKTDMEYGHGHNLLHISEFFTNGI